MEQVDTPEDPQEARSQSESSGLSSESSDEFPNYPGKATLSMSSSSSELVSFTDPSRASIGIETEIGLRSLPSYTGRGPCNYCLFFRSPYGCLKGNDCSFCHHAPPPQLGAPKRPRKVRRARCKHRVQQLLEMLTVEREPAEVVNAIQAMAQRNGYSHILCQSLLDDWLSRNGDAGTLPVQSTGSHQPSDGSCCRATLWFSV